MRAALWLAGNELCHFRARVAVSVALVAAPVALCVAVEMTSNAREKAAAAEIDHIGAPLRIVPAGVTAGQIARFSSDGRTIPEAQVGLLESELSRWVRTVDARLVLTASMGGIQTPVVGVDSQFLVSRFELSQGLDAGEVAIGFALAEARDYRQGDKTRLAGRDAVVIDVLSQTATSIDAAVIVPLTWAQELANAARAVNVLDLYLHAGASVKEIESYLRERHPEAELIRTPRGEVADRETGKTLRFNRWILYSISAVTVVIFLTIGAYLNVVDRRHELATLIAIGSTAGTVQLALVIRAVVIATAGSLVGYGGGALAVLIQAHLKVGGVSWSSSLPMAVVGGALVLSVLTTAPLAALVAFQDHVSLLQED